MTAANNSTDSAAHMPRPHLIAEMYERWALDMVVELAYHVSNDFIQRPRHYREIPEDVANFLSELRISAGSRSDLPDGNDRAAIYDALLDRSEIRAASAALREAAIVYSTQATDKSEQMLRQSFVDRLVTLRVYLNSLEGRSLATGHQRTGEIFAQATKVLTCHEVARVFGLPPAPRGSWPLDGVYNEDGAYLIEEIFRTLLQPLPIVSTLPRKFIIFQRLAHYGALTLGGVLDESSGWEKNDSINALTRSAYSWAMAANDLQVDTIRAWKDPEYRLRLTGVERTLVPDHPGGEIELTDALLGTFAARQSLTAGGQICCSGPTLDAGCSTITQGGKFCCSSGNICDTTTETGPFCTFYCTIAIA